MSKVINLIDFLPSQLRFYDGSTLRAWQSFKQILVRMNTIEPMVSDLSLDGYNCIKEWMQNEGYRANTIVNRTDKLKALIRAAGRNGYKISPDVKMMNAQGEDSGAVALTPNEVARIVALKLEPPLDIIRDVFIIGCYTGLRFSDYSRINESFVMNGAFSILTGKKKVRVVIPMAKAVKDILKKYKDGIPTAFSDFYFNKNLPTIGAKAKINDIIIIERVIKRKIVRFHKVKHEMISTHTARRTFATNTYLAGIPTARIMQITGHKTEASFFKYIRIGKEENAKLLNTHPFFTNT